MLDYKTIIIIVIVGFLIVLFLTGELKFVFKYEDEKKDFINETEKLKKLSNTELQVLEFLTLGYSNQKIAERQFVTIGTIKKHITHIFKKLEISKREQARAYRWFFDKTN
jgi:DNA-binding NarL/FixJ family response regulator